MRIFFIFFFSTPFFCFSQNNYITNKEYNEFITYVNDSLIRYTLGKEVNEDYLLINYKNEDVHYGGGTFVGVNWKKKIKQKDLNRINLNNLPKKKIIPEPDRLIWLKDSTINKSWATFLTKYYFSHLYFKDYPVYGLSSEQIQEYLNWKYSNNEKHFEVTGKFEINLPALKKKLQFTVGNYFEFYQNIRDSIVMRILGEEVDEEKYYAYDYEEEINPPMLNWKTKIDWKDTVILNTLKDQTYLILNKENKINNKKINYIYYWIDLRGAAKGSPFIKRETVSVYNKKYMKETSPIYIKDQLKNKTEIDYSSLTFDQLRAYYYWKKSDYLGCDIFEGFIPYDSDIELLRNGKFVDTFNIFIPTIQVK